VNLNQVLYGSLTLFDLILVIIIFIFVGLISKAISINIRRSFQDRLAKDEIRIITKVINIFGVIIALVITLPILGVDPTGLAVAGGIAAIIIGFASQGIVGNFISGIFLLVERPIKIADSVNIDGISGTVVDVRIISTTVKQFDGVYVRMPNEKVFTSNIKNYNVNVARRFEYTIGIRYQDDAEKAIEIIKKIIEEHPFTLVNPEPQTFVDELGENSVNIIVRIWAPAAVWYGVKMELLWKMKSTLEENDIKIPFPQRELWFNNEFKGEVLEGSSS